MNETKFACPQCSQHIACDRDYADMCVLCPSCGQPMEVPRLSASDASRPDLCVVASIPTPKRRFASRIPTIDLWTEKEWEERYRETTTPPQQTPAWLVFALGTLIAAVLLKAGRASGWTILVGLLVGTGLSCYFLAKSRMIETGPVYSIIGSIALLLFAIPAVALGMLFIGCTVCH